MIFFLNFIAVGIIPLISMCYPLFDENNRRRNTPTLRRKKLIIPIPQIHIIWL